MCTPHKLFSFHVSAGIISLQHITQPIGKRCITFQKKTGSVIDSNGFLVLSELGNKKALIPALEEVGGLRKAHLFLPPDEFFAAPREKF